jgi:hypothetical protein
MAAVVGRHDVPETSLKRRIKERRCPSFGGQEEQQGMETTQWRTD